ncbi:MAG: replication factor C large subunit [Candidatus Lokiarchaeota archaeon]|nr:replication factor C large subunit [Candidatus Lokiarchaeota archaeon]
MIDGMPWPERFRPKSISEVVGNRHAMKTILGWIETWKNGIPKKKGLLLVGPPGVGKTASVIAIASEFDVELVEFNASDKRNKAHIENQVWIAATQHTLDDRMRIILLDEVDGLSGTSDRGGAGAISKVIDQAVHPIIMTANDPDSSRLKKITKKSLVIEFSFLEKEDVKIVLQRILTEVAKEVAESDLEQIIQQSGGDLRAAIADLQTFIEGSKNLTRSYSRDTQRNITETLQRMFMTTEISTAKRIISEGDIGFEDLLLWLEENIHLHLRDTVELEMGLEALSLADLTLGRIMQKQSWKLLSYFYDLIANGITSSRYKTPYRKVSYSRPSWPLTMWKGGRRSNKKKKLYKQIGNKSGVSNQRVWKTHAEAIDRIIKKNPKMLSEFATWLKVKRSVFG